MTQVSRAEIAVVSWLLAFASMSYEMSLARAIGSLSGDVVASQSLTIGVFILAMGFGAWLHGRRPQRDPLRTLTILQVGLATAGALSGVLFLLSATAGDAVFAVNKGLLSPLIARDTLALFTGQWVTFLLGTLCGFEIPLLTDLSSKDEGGSWVLAWHYFGGLVGAIVAPIMLYPALDAVFTTAAVSSINVLVCFWAAIRSDRAKRFALPLIPVAAAMLVASNGIKAQDFHLKVFYEAIASFYPPPPSFKDLSHRLEKSTDVTRIRSPYQAIDMVTTDDGGFALYLDHKLQFTSQWEKIYHESMVHGSIALWGSTPKKVLILGGGDGLLIRELLRYGSDVESITLVELDPMMIELATREPRLSKLNQGALEHPKVKVLIEDAFQHLRTTSESYDAVFVDFPFPVGFDLGKLYSVEFYSLLKRRLNENAYAVLDFPLRETMGGPRSPRVDVLYSTLDAAGFKERAAYGELESFVLIAPEPRPLKMNYEHLQRLVTNNSLMNIVRLDELVGKVQIDRALVNSVFKPIVVPWRGH